MSEYILKIPHLIVVTIVKVEANSNWIWGFLADWTFLPKKRTIIKDKAMSSCYDKNIVQTNFFHLFFSIDFKEK